MTIHVGIKPDKVAALATEFEFGLGDIGFDKAGRSFQYVEADATIAVADVVIMASDFGASPTTVTLTAPAAGQGKAVGVALVAMATGTAAWVARQGEFLDFNVNVASGAVVYTETQSTAVSGQLDDNSTPLSSSEILAGLVTTGTESGNLATFSANWPYVQRTQA